MALEPIEAELPPHGVDQCDFCKAPKSFRRFIFMNETRDTFVCDSCVAVLSTRLVELMLLDEANASTPAN